MNSLTRANRSATAISARTIVIVTTATAATAGSKRDSTWPRIAIGIGMFPGRPRKSEMGTSLNETMKEKTKPAKTPFLISGRVTRKNV